MACGNVREVVCCVVAVRPGRQTDFLSCYPWVVDDGV